MSWADTLAAASPAMVYAALFAGMAVEGVGFPLVPYEPVFLVAGVMISRGNLALPAAVLAGAAGNLAGNLVGYQIGRLAGRRLMQRPGRFLRLDPERLVTVEGWFRRYGAATIFIGRFFGLIRTPAILGSGFAGISLWQYSAFSLLGGTLWNLAWLAAAAAYGPAAIEAVQHYGALVLAGLLILVPLGYLPLRRRKGSSPG